MPDREFSPAEIQLFLVANRKSPATAVQNLHRWIVKVQEEKRKPTLLALSKESSSAYNTSPVTLQVCVQVEDMPVAALETGKTVTESYCCSCKVIEDIRGICIGEKILSVNLCV